jgi:hypothetical protein
MAKLARQYNLPFEHLGDPRAKPGTPQLATASGLFMILSWARGILGG